MIVDYFVARNLEEAIAMRRSYQDKARILAGGTDSFSHLSEGEGAVVVVDISRASDLNQMNRNDRNIEIGAAVTLSRLLRTNWLGEEVPALAEAVSQIGSPQIRNLGTVVGNILTGRAVAGVRVCAASLGGILTVKGPDGDRMIEVEKLDDKRYKLENHEIAVSLVIPRNRGVKGSAYRSFTPRKGFSYASASVSVSVRLNAGKFKSVNVLASPILPKSARLNMEPCNTCAGSCRICRVMHLSRLEKSLLGRSARDEEIERACNTFDWHDIPIRDSTINGPADYRRQLLRVLSKKALTSALHRFSQTA